jgi:hypothetical protein
MKGNISAALMLVISFLAPGAAADQNKIQVVGSIDFAFKNLSFNPAGNLQSTPLTTINPSIVFARNRWYSSFSYDGPTGSGTVVTIENNRPSVLQMSRSDFLFTVGYRLADPLSVFGGWLSGNINAVQSGVRDDGGGGDAFYAQTIKYLEQGPFLGLAYSMPFGKRSNISFSAAYANMQGSLDESRSVAGSATSFTSDSFGVSGLSYAIIMTGDLTGSLTYRTGLKFTNYEGKATNGTINEQYSSVFFGLANYF